MVSKRSRRLLNVYGWRSARDLAWRAVLGVLVAVCAFMSPGRAVGQLNENCTVSIFNRTAQVGADGRWRIDNLPTVFGPVRARASCVENGQTRSGQTGFHLLRPDLSVGFDAEIVLGDIEPIAEKAT